MNNHEFNQQYAMTRLTTSSNIFVNIMQINLNSWQMKQNEVCLKNIKLVTRNLSSYDNKILIKLFFIVAIFNFGYNFVTTAEYVYYREILEDCGFTSAIKISILLSVSLIALCCGAIFGGFYNDSLRTKYGQRVPVIFSGAIGAAMFFLFVPLITQFISNLLVIFWFLLFVFIFAHALLGAAYAAWLAVIADLFRKNERVWIGAVINILSALGAAIALILFSILIDTNLSWAIWLVMAGALGTSTLITSIMLPKTNPSNRIKSDIRKVWQIPLIIVKYGGTIWILLLIMNSIWCFGSHLVETGLVDSLIERFNVSDIKASISSTMMLAIYFFIFFLPITLLIAKIKRTHASIIASIFYGGYCLSLALMKDFNGIFFIIIFGSVGNIFLSNLQIIMPIDIVPRGREASFLGTFFVFGTIMKPIATLFQGIILEGNEKNVELRVFGGYPWVYIFAGIAFLLAIILLLIIRIKKVDEKELKEK